MPRQEHFTVQITGKLNGRLDRSTVIAHASKLFKVDSKRAESLLQNKSTVIRSELNRAQATKVRSMIESRGMMCEMIPSSSDSPASSPEGSFSDKDEQEDRALHASRSALKPIVTAKSAARQNGAKVTASTQSAEPESLQSSSADEHFDKAPAEDGPISDEQSAPKLVDDDELSDPPASHEAFSADELIQDKQRPEPSDESEQNRNAGLRNGISASNVTNNGPQAAALEEKDLSGVRAEILPELAQTDELSSDDSLESLTSKSGHPLAASYRRLVPDLSKIKAPAAAKSSARTLLALASATVLVFYIFILLVLLTTSVISLMSAFTATGVLVWLLPFLALASFLFALAGLRALIPIYHPSPAARLQNEEEQQPLKELCDYLVERHQLSKRPHLMLSYESSHQLEVYRRLARLFTVPHSNDDALMEAHEQDVEDAADTEGKAAAFGAAQDPSVPRLSLSYTAIKALSGRQNLGEIAGELGKLRFFGKRRAFIQALAYQLNDAKHGALGYREKLERAREGKPGFFRYVVYKPLSLLLKVGSLLVTPFAASAMFCENKSARAEREFNERVKLACMGAQEYSASFFRRAYSDWACAEVVSDLFSDPKNHASVRSIFTLIDHKATQLKEDQQIAIQDELLQATIPGDTKGIRERMMLAEELDPSVPSSARFTLEHLIEDKAELEENLTRLFYRNYGRFYDDERLVDPDDVMVALKGKKANLELCKRYYNRWYESSHVWRFDEAEMIEGISTLSAKREKLNEVVKAIRHHTFDYERVKRDLPDLHKRVTAYRFILGVQKAGYAIKDESILGVANDQIRFVPDNYAALNKEYEGASAKRIRLSCLVANRLMLAISLALEDEDQLHGVYLLNLMQIFDELAQQLDSLRMRVELLPLYQERVEIHGELKHKPEIARLIRRIEFVVGNIIDETSSLRYRYSPKFEFLVDSLMQYLNNGWNFSANTPERIIDQYWKLSEGFASTNDEISAQAAKLATKAEEILGIEKARLV